MKETITSLAVFIAISLAATVVWAGGMDGGMMGGDGGYMMHSYGDRHMGSNPDHRSFDDQYHGQRRFDDRQQARRDDDRDRQQWGGGDMMHSDGDRHMWGDRDRRGDDDQYRGQRRFDDRHQARRDDDHDRRPWGGGYMMHSHSFGDRPMWSDPDDRDHDGAFHGQSGFGER